MVYSFSKKFKGVDILATEKNITMKQFNGTDYDTLYPKTIASQIPDVYSKTEILTTETLAKYGLTADKLPNDVFQQIKTLIDNTQNNIESRAKIQTGSYVGTGTSGASNPCSLTFEFMPKLFAITSMFSTNSSQPEFALTQILSKATSSSDRYNSVIDISALSNTEEVSGSGAIYWIGAASGSGPSAVRTYISGNTLVWYTTAGSANASENASSQYNATNYKYHWIAIG